MGQDVSCPCQNNDSNVYYTDDDTDVVSVVAIKVPTSPAAKASVITSASNPFSEPKPTPLLAEKSRKWAPMLPKDAGGPSGMDSSAGSTQRPGEDAIGDSGSHTSREELDYAHGPGEMVFPEKRTVPDQEQFYSAGSGADDIAQSHPEEPPSPSVVESEAARAARKKQEAHNDRIVATFNSVMLADGLKVLKHHRRSSKKAASRVIRYVPDYGGALVWDKPLRQPGAKASRVPLDAINQVELETRIVWISAGNERVGFETSKTEDADLMYQAICILVDRCHA